MLLIGSTSSNVWVGDEHWKYKINIPKIINLYFLYNIKSLPVSIFNLLNIYD